MRTEDRLPEVTSLRDARPSRPENAVGIGDFWYEPGIWDLPLSPAARVLYAGLCSYLGHGEINRRDLRNTLKGRDDLTVVAALEELVRHELLSPTPEGYAVRSVRSYELGGPEAP